jgi:teichuronic acid biosynthesis protein TuaE
MAVQKNDFRHRTILAALLITLAGGADIFAIPAGPLSLYPLRIVIVSASVYYLFFLLKNPQNRRFEKAEWIILLPISMILYGTAFLVHAESKSEAIKELGNLVFGAGFLFSFGQAVKHTLQPAQFLKSVTYWPLGFILTLALFEIATKSHLPSPYATEILITDPIHFVRLSPSGTFGNPNHLAIFLVICFFILFAELLEKKDILKPLLFITLILIVLWFTLSRFGMMSILLPLLYTPYHFSSEISSSFKKNRNKWFSIMFLFVGIVIIVSMHGGFTGGMFAAEGEGPEIPIDPLAKSSRTVRLNMLKNGWDIFQKSHFLGVGPGQFSELMRTQSQAYPTFGFTDAHSGTVEIASQYGIVIFLLWALWGVWMFMHTLRTLRKGVTGLIPALFTILAFIPISAANSSFIGSPLTWAFLGVLNALVFSFTSPKMSHAK